MDVNSYRDQTCSPSDISDMSNIVFKEGHLEKIDDLVLLLYPLANVVYYKYIRQYDDREYAKDDLISEAILRLYQDMSLRWDKFIRIDAYYGYYSMILKNSMIGSVHRYHNYYSTNELDPEMIDPSVDIYNAYDVVEMRATEKVIRKEIIALSKRLLRCRPVNTNLLLKILKLKYVDKTSVSSLRSQVRVLGISNTLFDFYCEHVDYIHKLAYNYQYALAIGGCKKKMIERIASTIDRYEDITYKMLATQYYDSIIPEIYAEFGADVAKKFVRTFSNRTVVVPDYRDFCDDLLGGVVLTLARGDKSNLYDVALEYDMSYKSLSRIYNKAAKYIDKEESVNR